MRLPSLRVSVALIVAGFVLIAVNACHNRRYPLRPISLAVPLDQAGFEAQSDFVAAIDGRYEVELAFGPASTEEQRARLAMPETSPVDLQWTVSDETGVQIAAGSCREFLYLQGWTPLIDRLLARSLFHETDGVRHFTARRGVGAFQALKGGRYSVGVRVPAATEAADTRLEVRIERIVWSDYVGRTTLVAWTGIALAGTGGVLLMLQVVFRLLRRGS